jgi:hypothetical protein
VIPMQAGMGMACDAVRVRNGSSHEDWCLCSEDNGGLIREAKWNQTRFETKFVV